MTLDTDTITPRLSQVMKAAVEAGLREMHVALPGQVTEYDPEKNMASILPLLKRQYKSAPTAHALPIINGVPVIFPRTNDAHFIFPIKPGDTGQVLFNERSIDAWTVLGGCVNPGDARMFDLNDAVFFPGLYPVNRPLVRKGAPTSVEIKHGEARIEITDKKKFAMENDMAELFTELVNLLTQLASGFEQLNQSHMVNTMLGPQQPINFSAYGQIKSQLDTIKGKLEALKK